MYYCDDCGETRSVWVLTRCSKCGGYHQRFFEAALNRLTKLRGDALRDATDTKRNRSMRRLLYAFAKRIANVVEAAEDFYDEDLSREVYES